MCPEWIKVSFPARRRVAVVAGPARGPRTPSRWHAEAWKDHALQDDPGSEEDQEGNEDQEAEPRAYRFLLDFAKDNELVVIDPTVPASGDYCPLPGSALETLVK